MIDISKRQARQYLLAHQHLYPPRQLSGKQGIMDFIQRVGCIQFDPLNVVGVNPHVVLQSRIAGFTPDLLSSMLYEDRSLVDHFDKQLAIYPVTDWPYFARHRTAMRTYYSHPDRPAIEHAPVIREALEQRGPLSSSDIEFNETIQWHWGTPTRTSRAILESMYAWGELVVHHKSGNRKVYDLAHKHIPGAIYHAPDPNPADKQYDEWHTLRRIGGIGLAQDRGGDIWLGISFKTPLRRAAIQRMLADGRLIEFTIEGQDRPYLMRADDLHTMDHVLNAPAAQPQAAVIAALDNLTWDRRIIEDLFDFVYRWEVYVPAAKRQWGYYVLPILYGDRFVARFEAGRDKKSGDLHIIGWWWEDDVNTHDEAMRTAIHECFTNFARYLKRDHITIDGSVSTDLDWLTHEIC